jgi:hypothetical protein
VEPWPYETHLYVDAMSAQAWMPMTKDIRLEATGLQVRFDRDERVVEATVDLSTLTPVGILRGGVLDPDGLSERDRAWVSERVHRRILPDAGPAVFQSRRFGGVSVSGTLAWNGVERDVRLQFRDESRWRRAEVALDLRDFQVTPYRGRSGLFRVQPVVLVQVTTVWGGRGDDWYEKTRV